MIKDPHIKKYKGVIEEICVEEFKFEVPDDVDIDDYVRENYYNELIVLKPSECQFRQMEIHDLETDSITDWKEF